MQAIVEVDGGDAGIDVKIEDSRVGIEFFQVPFYSFGHDVVGDAAEGPDADDVADAKRWRSGRSFRNWTRDLRG
jgi:hypothetical protein